MRASEIGIDKMHPHYAVIFGQIPLYGIAVVGLYLVWRMGKNR